MRNQRGAIVACFLNLIQNSKPITTNRASPYQYVAGVTVNVPELSNRNTTNTSPDNQHTNSCIAENLVTEGPRLLNVTRHRTCSIKLAGDLLDGVENLT